MNQSYLATISLIFLIFLTSCSSKKNENDEIVKKELKNPNLVERAKENAAKNPIFDSSRKKSSGTFEFSTSNVLWRATLKTLDFIPLNNTDYSGGMIVTDWYGNSSEQIKISVQFLSNELSSTSIKVIAHKKKCKENNCFTEPANESFNIEIKDKILNEARAIKINDDKTKK
jgi:hypothetical protein